MALQRPSIAQRLAAESLRRTQLKKKANSKKQISTQGLTIRKILSLVPPYVRYNGGFVSTTKLKFDPKRKIYLTETRTNELGEKPRFHKQEIQLLEGDKLSDKGSRVKIWCDCEFHTYYCEVALNRYGSADIRNSNGEFPYTTNPRGVPLCCLASNTLITTVNGSIKIEDIKIGDFVYGMDNKAHYVLNKACTGYKKTRIVRLRNKSYIEGTDNHYVLTIDKTLRFTWKRLDDLRPKDLVVTKNKIGNTKFDFLLRIKDVLRTYSIAYIKNLSDLEKFDLSASDITTIRQGKAQPVYDLTIEDAEHFIANNIVTHNCKHILVAATKIIKSNK